MKMKHAVQNSKFREFRIYTVGFLGLIFFSVTAFPVLADCVSDQLMCNNRCTDINCINGCTQRALACVQNMSSRDSDSYGGSNRNMRSYGGDSSSGYSGQSARSQNMDAIKCISSESHFRKPPNEEEMIVSFVNNCNTTVKVDWCTKQRNGTWLAESTNLRAGQKQSVPEFNAAGPITYWACTDLYSSCSPDNCGQ